MSGSRSAGSVAMLVLAIVAADLALRLHAYEIMHIFDLAFVIALSIPVFAAVRVSLWVREAVAATRADPAADLAGTEQPFEDLAHLRRARDLMDREYARPLDVLAMARPAMLITD